MSKEIPKPEEFDALHAEALEVDRKATENIKRGLAGRYREAVKETETVEKFELLASKAADRIMKRVRLPDMNSASDDDLGKLEVVIGLPSWFHDVKKLLSGDKTALMRMLIDWEKFLHVYRGGDYRSAKREGKERQSIIPMLNTHYPIDGILIAARSGVHFGYLVKGLFDGLKKKYPKIKEPFLVGMWHKVADVGRYWNWIHYQKLFQMFPTLESLKHASDEELQKVFDPDQIERFQQKGKLEGKMEDFRNKFAPFLYEALDLTKEQVRAISKSSHKKKLNIEVFDESNYHGHTGQALAFMLSSAMEQLKEEGITPELTRNILPIPMGGAQAGSYKTWDEEVKIPMGPKNEDIVKIIRPSQKNIYRHALHRIQIEAAREVGRMEVEYLLGNNALNEEDSFLKKNLEGIGEIYSR